MTGALFQATLFLFAAVVAVPLAMRLGLGSVLGYLISGILIGPVFGLGGAELQDLQHFAEFGVVMMLFLIGLELDPGALWDMRHRLVGLGGLQIGLTTLAIAGGAFALGQPVSIALAIGLVLSLSSTAIVLQTLSEKKLMQTSGGRSAFSVLLTQDIAVIPMLAFIPLLAIDGLNAGHHDLPHDTGHGGEEMAVMTLMDGLPGWGVTLVTLAAVGAVIIGGRYLTRPVFHYIHATKLREMYTAVALLFVLGVATLMLFVGLSPALGTFLAGVVLANSEFRHELEANIAPFKGLLLGLFFLTVGAGINFDVLVGAPLVIGGLTLGLILTKGAILLGLGLLFKLKRRSLWLFTLSLAQAGEFGFVLLGLTTQTDVIPHDLAGILLLVIALSMLLTPLLFILFDFANARLQPLQGEAVPHDTIDDQQPIIIAGIGRFGQVVNRMVQMAGFKTTVLDHDLNTIELMRRFGFKGFFGDPTRPELLHAAGLDKAQVLVVAVDDPKNAVKLVEYARRERPDLHIVARARDRVHVYELYRAGADDIVREMFDSSLRAGRYVLENMGLTEYDAHEMEVAFYKADRESLRELAELWIPGVPVAQNNAYVERSRELQRDLETALVTTLNDEAETEASRAADRPGPNRPG